MTIFNRKALWNFAIFVFFACTMPMYGTGIKNYLPDHPLIFDIGAHKGNKTFFYLHALDAHLVVAVEPQLDCVQILQDKFGKNSKVAILPMAIANKKGVIPFLVNSSATELSTAAEDWQTGRFKRSVWNAPIEVHSTTLDALIEEYGIPDYCKIDVEGYELNVLQGLTQPVPILSFEFASEFLDKKTEPCLQYLHHLGYRHFNVAFGESETFALREPVTWEVLLTMLKGHPDKLLWGDIYAQY